MIKLFTEVPVPDFSRKIGFDEEVMVLGSCFADSMGERLLRHGYKAMVNPFGTLYNPGSIYIACSELQSATPLDRGLCVPMGAGSGLFCSFYHHTSFARPSIDEFLENANSKLAEASAFWKRTKTVIVNLDTAFVWRRSANGLIVANCLKRPAHEFTRERLSVKECAKYIKTLTDLYPNKHFIFSISPIRHPGADGAHESTLSKATLQLALDEVLRQAPNAEYFPSYEILLDELRDYRFYADDLMHPSEKALDLIWEKFCTAALRPEDEQRRKENEKQWRRSQHIEKKR